ncbi:MAG: DUF58 domain-containing protein [Verrucomicrobiae bacterium]|nr:DUF58 domain-containing protein [Verrucomicrobiae bacterium]
MKARVTIELDELLQLKAEARGFSFLPRQPVHSLLAGRHASRLRGRGLSFEELRHYQPGDDVRSIDWRATARRGSPHVRVYNEERERPVLVVVDQRNPMFFGSRRAMKSVVAAEITALAAWRTLDVGDRVGGIVFNDADIAEVRPHRSQARALGLLHEVIRKNHQLASSDPPTGEVTLNDALEATLQVAKHDHLVVLVSDFDGADEETRRLATRLAAHNDVLAVLVYDPLGASLRGRPGMRAMDRGEHWEIPPGRDFSQSFQQEFSDLLDQWREIFRALKVPMLPISTDQPVAAQIRGLFGETGPT